MKQETIRCYSIEIDVHTFTALVFNSTLKIGFRVWIRLILGLRIENKIGRTPTQMQAPILGMVLRMGFRLSFFLSEYSNIHSVSVGVANNFTTL